MSYHKLHQLFRIFCHDIGKRIEQTKKMNPSLPTVLVVVSFIFCCVHSSFGRASRRSMLPALVSTQCSKARKARKEREQPEDGHALVIGFCLVLKVKEKTEKRGKKLEASFCWQ